MLKTVMTAVLVSSIATASFAADCKDGDATKGLLIGAGVGLAAGAAVGVASVAGMATTAGTTLGYSGAMSAPALTGTTLPVAGGITAIYGAIGALGGYMVCTGIAIKAQAEAAGEATFDYALDGAAKLLSIE
jgi:hypothetical protein